MGIRWGQLEDGSLFLLKANINREGISPTDPEFESTRNDNGEFSPKVRVLPGAPNPHPQINVFDYFVQTITYGND